jgi:hypothetical protein
MEHYSGALADDEEFAMPAGPAESTYEFAGFEIVSSELLALTPVGKGT